VQGDRGEPGQDDPDGRRGYGRRAPLQLGGFNSDDGLSLAARSAPRPLSAMIVPRVKISPPQTPCGSWRSTAPARQELRTGQDRQ